MTDAEDRMSLDGIERAIAATEADRLVIEWGDAKRLLSQGGLSGDMVDVLFRSLNLTMYVGSGDVEDLLRVKHGYPTIDESES